jgi:hypothetical protein
VRAERPAEVLAQIAALPSVGDWALEPLPPQAIEDVYFDDASGSLGRRRIALRIRRVDAVVGRGAAPRRPSSSHGPTASSPRATPPRTRCARGGWTPAR